MLPLVALSLSALQLNELNFCWNSIYHAIFHFNRWESVTEFIHGLGRLNFMYIFYVRHVNLYHHLLAVKNLTLNNLLWKYFISNYCKDISMISLFLNRHDAITAFQSEFYQLFVSV